MSDSDLRLYVFTWLGIAALMLFLVLYNRSWAKREQDRRQADAERRAQGCDCSCARREGQR